MKPILSRTTAAGAPSGSVGEIRPPPSRFALVDASGLLLVGALAAWTAYRGGTHVAVARELALLTGVTVAFVSARLLARSVGTLPAGGVALAVAVTTAVVPGALSGTALASPLGYANANGALAAHATAGAGLLLLRSRRGGVHVLALVTLGWLVLAAWLTGSLAAGVTATAIAAASLAVAHRRPLSARVAVTLTGGVVLLAVGLTVAAGLDYGTHGSAVDRAAAQALDGRRTALWHDAVRLTRDHPLRGVGVGAFAVRSPTARADADTRWAHSAFLQEAAETGVPGAALLGLVAVWSLVSLTTCPRPGEAVVGAAAVGGLWLHASVDYVLAFPLVPLAAAVVLGVVTARRPYDLPLLAVPRLRGTLPRP